MPTFGNFIHTQLILKIPKPTTSFASKIVIITGASSGLGKEAAKHIVRLGASKVILACRNTSKGNKTKAEIESSLRCGPDIIEVWQVDVESPPSVKEFVDRANKLPRLDVLINNAGMTTIKFQVAYGTERTMAVNVIGTYLLALQLIPKLKETAKAYGVTPHMTFVGSAMYDAAKYPEEHGDDIFDWLSDKSHVNTIDQYNLTKLVLLYAIIKLASIVDPITNDKSRDSNPIVINSLDPCFCKTGLAGELTGVFKAVFKSFEFLFARSAEEGSRLVVAAASAGRQTHGLYMRAGALQKYAPFITSRDGVKKSNYIWEQLGRKLEQLQPGILANVNTV
ncbi:hypothetical protein V1520DRAFT_387841 [Lipomyces starkeyi]